MGAGAGTDSASGPLAVLACGALARDVAEVVRRLALPVDVHGVSALVHLDPARLVAAVDARLAVLAPRYARVAVMFGDCGTAGALDAVLARYPAARPGGVHCYEWWTAGEFRAITAARPGTYFLTDWLVRNWDLAVVRGLGLDRFPWLKDTYFHALTDLLYLQQHPGLEDDASRIADWLGLPLAVRPTGVDPLEPVLIGLLDGLVTAPASAAAT